MKSQMKQVAMLAIFSAVSFAALARADGPATQPAAPTAQKPDAPAGDDQDFVVSGMRVQQLKGFTYLFVSSKTDLTTLADHIRQSVDKIQPALKTGQVKPAGPLLIIYHGMNQDPTNVFPLQVGFPVADDTKAADGMELKKLDSFRCATVLFSGSMQDIHRAYEAVFTDLFNAGLEPTDEGRQAVLMFEGPDSVNNVAMIEVGVK